MDYRSFLPTELKKFSYKQELIPAIAKNDMLMGKINDSIKLIPSSHYLYQIDSREMASLSLGNIHLIVTSPPYWNLKNYNDVMGQLGHVNDYEQFLYELDKIWKICFDLLVPGGRLVCVVGDVCLSRRKNGGEHKVVPLHASIQEHCRKIGFNNVAPIIWHKISNVNYEAKNSSRFLGKPYEPNGIIKNDIEFILMQRKPGGYRKPSVESRLLSIISDDKHKRWFKQIWAGLNGASTRNHPAPYPLALAERLVRMFSFVGDTILDPFAGTGTTNLAAARWGRNSIGLEIDPEYINQALCKLKKENVLTHKEGMKYKIIYEKVS